MRENILIVEDDITFATMLKTWIGKKGFLVYTSSNFANAQKLILSQSIDIVLSDLRLPDRNGIELLSWMREQGYNIPLIIMTNYADIQTAVQAMKEGASDYVSKPVQPDELLRKIKEALLVLDNEDVKVEDIKSDAPQIDLSPKEFIEGESPAALQLYKYVRLVAPTPMSVLINGASGTGKEYVTRRIHQLSKRSSKPFVAIDCGSIPKELAASEFFGHVKGSFTGAISDKIGAFAEANGGTLFLDEIGNLSYDVQVQLLRALQERKFRPVGSSKEFDFDVRLICATNEDLHKAIENGTFREDLFHRINEFTLRMPSLKERVEDIMLFANFFLAQSNKELEKRVEGFDAQAIEVLKAYSWPGNLRQLKNTIKRATLLAQGDYIEIAEIKEDLYEENRKEDSMALRNADTEKEQIIKALKITGNNKSKAGRLLGIDRKTLYNKLKQYDIQL